MSSLQAIHDPVSGYLTVSAEGLNVYLIPSSIRGEWFTAHAVEGDAMRTALKQNPPLGTLEEVTARIARELERLTVVK